jgi:chromosome partitioning protein
MMKIISVLNHKGGVGKTTFAGSVSQALALIGYRVLAIDNDSQHNLSSLLGVGVKSPNIRDVYRALPEAAPQRFVQSVRETGLSGLHLVTSCGDLCNADVNDPLALKQTIAACRLERFYDFICIDNAPGLDRLQEAAIHASHEIFVPTELRQFAVDGLVEMEQLLSQRYPGACRITKIIPNFYRNTRRHNTYISALSTLFPGLVTPTAIGVDSVFDEVVTEGKILFLNRLYSKGAAYYLKIVHELFDLDEETVRKKITEKRQQHMSDTAKEHFQQFQTQEGHDEKRKG